MDSYDLFPKGQRVFPPHIPRAEFIVNARYEALFFDAGHTLLECTNPTEVGWANSLAGMGGPSAEALSAAFEAVLGEWEARLGGAESLAAHRGEWSEIYRQVLKAVGFSGDPGAAVEIMWDVWLYGTWVPYPEVPPVLATLRENGIKLAVVSNWPPTLELTLDHLNLTQYFDAIVCSSLLGCAKPAAAIFDHAIERIAVRRDRVLHIGDNYDADVMGARAAGLDVALVLRTANASSNSYRPTLRSLDEIFALLG